MSDVLEFESVTRDLVEVAGTDQMVLVERTTRDLVEVPGTVVVRLPGEVQRPGFTYSQNAPSDTWVIEHQLGYYPAATVIDSAGSEVEGAEEHVSLNLLVIRFCAPFSGVAHLS